MPELPDVEMYRKEAEKCKNQVIGDFISGDEKLADISLQEFSRNLKGEKFSQAIRRGKYLFLTANNKSAGVFSFQS